MTRIYLDGDTYNNRPFIRNYERCGATIFRWDGHAKEWWAEVHDHEIDEIVEDFENDCPAVQVHCNV